MIKLIIPLDILDTPSSRFVDGYKKTLIGASIAGLGTIVNATREQDCIRLLVEVDVQLVDQPYRNPDDILDDPNLGIYAKENELIQWLHTKLKETKGEK